ncbi:hypothetical protein NB311A_21121 [Nitrobacter sp. Nb-311A]|uniref:hypothetical protein n=1 Tax=Nitrobacter sp. Nb-311A TaxID=314253 RepID=UPI0000687A96|nr:hypothetical protein [Nitrobacter sp. Nb-311A]EAQ36480.1 hypothetical protein NB311A_21121 [Nitrobacter sp. Nb-311A]
MTAATEERAEDTIATEEEIKAEAERLDKLLRQIEAELFATISWRPSARSGSGASGSTTTRRATRARWATHCSSPRSRPCSPRSTTTASPPSSIATTRATRTRNLTDLAEHDYRVMQKDEADYEWK